MSIRSAALYEIVRLIDLQAPGQTGYCVLVASPFTKDLTAELQDELACQASANLTVIDARNLSAMALIEELRELANTIVLIHGLEAWSDGQFASLDVNRSRLETGAFLLFMADLETVARFLDQAPNLRSYVGGNIFRIAPDPASMSPEEIAGRLDQLRSHYGLTDEEVAERAREGSLPAEPHFAEWLVLLGSGPRV